MIHRLIYEHELPSSGGLVLSNFTTYLSGSLVTFRAGDILPEDKLRRLIGVDRLPIRDLKKEPPRKNIIMDMDTGEETTHAKELRKLRDIKEEEPEGIAEVKEGKSDGE
jgi:hypothetical protein